MSDQELRDKLAEEHHGNVRGSWAEDFKAGWNAARDHYGAAFNESQHQLQEACLERENLRAELSKCKAEYAAYVSGRPGEWYVTQLQKERDQLKSELEKAKQFDLTAAVISKDISLTEECDQLRADLAMQKEITNMYHEESKRHAETAVAVMKTVASVQTAAEKLAEALKACEDVAYSYDMKPEGFSVIFCKAKQALAEYREKFPEGSK